MESEKRKGDEAIPEQLEGTLNELQMVTLHQMESFGWQLRFIRRPLFQDPVSVVFSADGDKIGILEEDGRINLHADIKVRG